MRKNGPLEVNLEQAVELLLGYIRDRRIKPVPGIIDKKVECFPVPNGVELYGNRCAERGKRPAVANVELQRDRLPTNFRNGLYKLVRLFGIAVVGDDHAHPAPGAFECGAAPMPRLLPVTMTIFMSSLLCLVRVMIGPSAMGCPPDLPRSLPISAFALRAGKASVSVGPWNSKCSN